MNNKRMQTIMLVEFSYLTPEIRGEFLEVLPKFVNETIAKQLLRLPVPVPTGGKISIGDIWVQSKRLVLVEFKCPTPHVREWFFHELLQYIDDGIAPDLPYEEKVVFYEGRYIHREARKHITTKTMLPKRYPELLKQPILLVIEKEDGVYCAECKDLAMIFLYEYPSEFEREFILALEATIAGYLHQDPETLSRESQKLQQNLRYILTDSAQRSDYKYRYL